MSSVDVAAAALKSVLSSYAPALAREAERWNTDLTSQCNRD